MELAFINIEIREICEDSFAAEAKLGLSVSGILQTRLADLINVKSVTDIPVGRPSEIEGQPYAYYKVDLNNRHRLIFRSAHVKPPLIGEKVDWSRVTRIMIIKIENDHE